MPVLSFKHGDIPLNQLSAGMKRIIEICYLIVWSVYENMQAAMMRSMAHPSLDITLLFDEVELHLHPKWQRQIMDAILSVGEALPAQYRMQYLITTHAPMVLASLEPLFNSDTDQLFSYDITSENKVALEPLKWSARGSANSWLSSLGLAEARSIKAEKIILVAEKAMNGENIDLSLADVEKELYDTLPEKEPFLVRWKLFRKFGENSK